ncbi:MAG: chemotaxis protein CheB [Gemmatimonadota bacterium]|nr:chemotaxis protein CheB [Gemmatimonadota bacterium]
MVPTEMRDIVVIGASAGGVEALRELVHDLPKDFPAALFVVVHIPTDSSSMLPRILERSGPLPAAHATDGEPIVPGRIYVAPPNHHLLLKRGAVWVIYGPKENGHRPAIDPLFRTAARAYRHRVIAVVLSGNLNDGSHGLRIVKAHGGTAVVQDPEDALYPGMPAAAIEHAEVDHVFPLAAIGDLLTRLVREPIPEDAPVPRPDEVESERPGKRAAEGELVNMSLGGAPSVYTCPECHGNLWEIREGTLGRYRCRVGHSFTEDSLIYEKGESLEAALWTALEALEEQASLTQRMGERAREFGNERRISALEERVIDLEDRARLVREVLLNGLSKTLPAETGGEAAAPVRRAAGYAPPGTAGA